MAEEKVWLASLHLEGAAVEWYYALECDHGILSWARFVEYIHMKFGPPIRSNGMAELSPLQDGHSRDISATILLIALSL